MAVGETSPSYVEPMAGWRLATRNVSEGFLSKHSCYLTLLDNPRQNTWLWNAFSCCAAKRFACCPGSGQNGVSFCSGQGSVAVGMFQRLFNPILYHCQRRRGRDSLSLSKMAKWTSSDSNGLGQQNGSQQEGNTGFPRRCGFLEDAYRRVQSDCKPCLSCDTEEE